MIEMLKQKIHGHPELVSGSLRILKLKMIEMLKLKFPCRPATLAIGGGFRIYFELKKINQSFSPHKALV
jgi:hypothetical protein